MYEIIGIYWIIICRVYASISSFGTILINYVYKDFYLMPTDLAKCKALVKEK